MPPTEIEKLLTEVLKDHGIVELTEIQREAIPKIMKGKNVLLIAPTGSGKTEAAMIPVMKNLMEHRTRGISCIYITPLRALNRDMLRRLEAIGSDLGLKVAVRHGDTTKHERRKQSLNPPDILITTPETFQILFFSQRLKNSLKNVKYIIVDEVHELAGDERGAQLAVAFERLRNLTNFQIIGLSATVGNPEEVSKFLVPNGDVEIISMGRDESVEIEVRAPSQMLEDVAAKMGCDVHYASALFEMWKEAEKHRATLLFVNTRCTAEDIGMRYNLWLKDPPIAVHHGSLSREHRIDVENKFKSGELKMLICTSSLELGIDVGIVDLVLQYNSPRQVTKMIQRVGRSGHRTGKRSKGVIYGDSAIELWEAGAIANLIEHGWIENVRIREKPIMVLFNQIVAMAQSCRRVKVDFAYNTVKRAYPFRNLNMDEFEKVLEFAQQVGKIWYDGSEFGIKRSGLQFFYENISMIPDEKSYRVVSVAGGFIGVLDERFVSTLNPGESFVMGGRTWRIISIEEEKVIVEYIMDISMPPSWLGEEIPVPYEIAAANPIKAVMNENARKMIENFNLWNANEVVIESGSGFVFVGLRGGTKTNFTLALIISSLLSQKIGESVEFSITPYSMAFFNPFIRVEDVEKILRSLRGIRSIVKIVARNSRVFKYVFLHVARKMGVIKKSASVSNYRIDKIVELYRDSILYEETVNKIMHDYMDVEHAERIIEEISLGVRKVKIRNLSAEAEALLKAKGDLATPTVATRPVIEAVHRRLLNEEMVFLCLSCRRSYHIKVRDFEKAICPFCGSVKVVLLKPYEEDLIEKIKSRKDDELSRGDMERLLGIEHLLRRHKRVGALVLAGRGIGLKTAARILSIPYEDEFEVVKRVLKEELRYAKNRQFWD